MTAIWGQLATLMEDERLRYPRSLPARVGTGLTSSSPIAVTTKPYRTSLSPFSLPPTTGIFFHFKKLATKISNIKLAI